MSETAQLFVTCLIDTFLPQIGEAVVRVLQRAGVPLAFPQGQTCCGQPAYNAGMRPQARAMAQHTLRVLEATSGPIIVPSGSCTAMITHGYAELFADDPQWGARAQRVAERTWEFSQFLVDVLGLRDLGARFPGKLAYHPSCHLLREMGIDAQPKTLLAHVAGAEVVPLPNAHECCGFGGVFAVEHPEISGEMLKRKIHHLEQSGAPTLVTCDAGCMLHIQGGLCRQGKAQKALHLAQVLEGR